MLSTGEALLRNILLNPDDDLARLVYADYLDETGDPKDAARAGVIRHSINERIVLEYHADQSTGLITSSHRGFICGVESALSVLLLPSTVDLFATNPITEVVINDKSPREWAQGDQSRDWSRGASWSHFDPREPETHWELPSRIFDRLKRVKPKPTNFYEDLEAEYDSAADALQAAKAAYILYGREKAGLVKPAAKGKKR